MSWLVTGGAGYIGAHVVRAFAEAGPRRRRRSTTSPAGTASSCPTDVPFVEGTHPRHRPGGARRCASTRSRASSTSPASSTPACRCSGRCTPTTQNVTGTRQRCSRRWQRHRRRQDRVLLQRRHLRHPRRRPRHRGDRRRARSRRTASRKLIGEWLLRDQARRHRAAAHVAALLQRRRLGHRPTLYDTSPHNLFPLVFEALRRGPDARGSTATTTPPPTAPACATTSTSPTSPSRTSPPPRRSRPARPLEPVYNLGSGDGLSVRADHGRHGPGHRHRLHARDRARAAPATRPASSPPASSPPATSTGGCGTPSTTWCASAWQARQAAHGG